MSDLLSSSSNSIDDTNSHPDILIDRLNKDSNFSVPKFYEATYGELIENDRMANKNNNSGKSIF